MKKYFNITGLCFPNEHYMADVSKKLTRAYSMIERGEYFIINRPRQYGKTTTLYCLADELTKSGEYIVFNMSFEGIGSLIFNDETAFAQGFVNLLKVMIEESESSFSEWFDVESKAISNLSDLSNLVTKLANKVEKKLVLMIDEVDQSSNNQLFILFLAMLRNKYLQRNRFKTFHSVVLAGLHDVKSLKLKLRPDEEQKYNSPWNIAAEFNVDMNLQASEIKPMLEEYAADKGVTMDTQQISERLFYYTSGYPFLVSKLCKIIDEAILTNKLERTWTVEDVDIATSSVLKETNTNFESLIKNLENNPALYDVVYKILMDAEHHGYSIHDFIIGLGLMHGILKNGRGFTLHNRIYEEIIYDYMMSKAKSKVVMTDYTAQNVYRLPDNRLNMEAVLLGFQAFMKKEYSRKDRDFLEKNGRLVFLAFIKPIINGSGYDFKEVQVSEERRLDVVITYFQHKYVAELKIWRGEKTHEKGLLQLTDYLEKQSVTEGYLLIFDHSEIKNWRSEWVEVAGKKIFAVWV